MKKYCFLLPMLLLLLLLPVHADELVLRGVWVSSVYQLDYPSSPGLSAEKLQEEADEIIENAKRWGLNAIFLQVRPCGDALYPSEIDPWSIYLTGEQGKAPDCNFDPLNYFITKCHAEKMQLHAWLNPYRLTRKKAENRKDALAQLCSTHPALDMQDCVVYHTDGCLYYDPGRPEVRKQVLLSIGEILRNYDVDGIHFDDYFYPGRDFADEETAAAFAEAYPSEGEFRRAAVNKLIEETHRLVKEKKPGCVFGVSPAGIWATADHLPQGAETKGSQSYFDHYADSRKWVREAMVDYIAPQIYWEIGAPAGDFHVLLDWWSDVCSCTGVQLYIGLAAYKSALAEPEETWYGDAELSRQLELMQKSSSASGAVFFRYSSLLENGLGNNLSTLYPKQPHQNKPLYAEQLTVQSPVISQAVPAGEPIDIICTAPLGSKVTAFYGNSFAPLRTDLHGTYSGNIIADHPYESSSVTTPILVCAERFGILSVSLSPSLITSVIAEQASVIETAVRPSPEENVHEVIFQMGGPCAVKTVCIGDVLTMDFSPADPGVLSDDPYFKEIRAEKEEMSAVYRFVLPDDLKKRSVRVFWEEDRVRLKVYTE